MVIKVGTSSLLRDDAVHLSLLGKLVEVATDLRKAGHQVVVVTSGAVGAGRQRLGVPTKPKELAAKQALAAVGMVRLMRFYDDFFSALGQPCAQVLLTAENLVERSQYINARNTFGALLEYGVVPIVNENDTVAVQELKFGDNDTLSAQVASLIGAEWLFLLTDVDGLYTSNPNSDPDAKLIPVVEDVSTLNVDTSTAGTDWGTGGMGTKLTAARLAAAAGCKTVIMNSQKLDQVPQAIAGGQAGTLFLPVSNPLRGRKRWLLALPSRGKLVIDSGAVMALERHKSLFAAGVRQVEGDFDAEDAVGIVGPDGTEIGRGICNYSAEEAAKVCGRHSDEIADELGYKGPDSMVSRNNLCLFVPTEDETPARGRCGSAAMASYGSSGALVRSPPER